ncbi:hypothetical protein SAMN05660484_01551 [Eubacterium ruminantium]|uniref:AAA domain (Dynein-related subfamily) n=1 Tax=Eubacterium ruminantium TaxID=42322 RepID=A0A1T4NDW6_9FIRM|nr:hypothetical protein [Eubacterium ruminantium]SCW53206.1 hypothetical protein SAMN05660484_01551 [Eubacterium ruminantium]SDM86127.1 hypothetical protein SAMN04490370_10726 [Eubacterium ruminantium]SJZ77462.1 hypothetical protein SAMN02745110_01551 [Eubacterium ruminantium]
MNGFLKWFFAFISEMLKGWGMIFKGIGNGFAKIFNIKSYIDIFKQYSSKFDAIGWILAILGIIIVVAIYVLIFLLIVFAIRKYIRFRHSIVSNEDLLEEISVLQRQVLKMTREKDEIMAMKVAQIGVPGSAALGLAGGGTIDYEGESPENIQMAAGEEGVIITQDRRFSKLFEVDMFYKTYTPPEYDNEIDLPGICERFRGFACSRMHLYYDIKTVRLFMAGMASTKLIILQGISGTGKTSLPYSFGKFLQVDTTIASVQPSWRDRTELFGYFNEFTKNFNETEVLKRIYDSGYNDNVNLILLDEMNIARIEYYFAEMLSILEMPNADEWELDLVPNVWSSDPENLDHGKLRIPQNIWYIGTANNDDSTYAISDKVYDRAQPINLDAKGVAFNVEDTPPLTLSFSHLNQLFTDAIEKYPVSQESMKKIHQLDLWVIDKLRVAFGNRIIKQMSMFVPVYVACGGDELDGIDYVLATKIFRKFESLNLAMLRDELKELVVYINKSFGKNKMNESVAYLERLQKLF